MKYPSRQACTPHLVKDPPRQAGSSSHRQPSFPCHQPKCWGSQSQRYPPGLISQIQCQVMNLWWCITHPWTVTQLRPSQPQQPLTPSPTPACSKPHSPLHMDQQAGLVRGGLQACWNLKEVATWLKSSCPRGWGKVARAISRRPMALSFGRCLGAGRNSLRAIRGRPWVVSNHFSAGRKYYRDSGDRFRVVSRFCRGMSSRAAGKCPRAVS